MPSLNVFTEQINLQHNKRNCIKKYDMIKYYQSPIKLIFPNTMSSILLWFNKILPNKTIIVRLKLRCIKGLKVEIQLTIYLNTWEHLLAQLCFSAQLNFLRMARSTPDNHFSYLYTPPHIVHTSSERQCKFLCKYGHSPFLSNKRDSSPISAHTNSER